MRKLNKNNGITLIALVITIIVMLILVSVSISMAVNGGLFNYAGKAVGDTENEINKEGKLGEGTGIQVGDTWYADIDSYTKGIGYKWITIYEGNTPTESGIIWLSKSKLLFTDETEYKITIEGIGEIETTGILMEKAEDGSVYYLFAINGEEIITWNSLEEFEEAKEKLEAIEDNSNLSIFLAGSIVNNGSAIMLDGGETEYTITKIEKYGKTLDIAYTQTEGEDLWESIVTFNISVETEPLTIEQKRNLVAYMFDSNSFGELLKTLNERK